MSAHQSEAAVTKPHGGWSYTVHTFAAGRGSRVYKQARKVVQQRYQESLPKVQLRGGLDLRNVYMKKWVGMTYTADGGQEDHVRQRLAMAGVEFGRQRRTLSSGLLLLPEKISAYDPDHRNLRLRSDHA